MRHSRLKSITLATAIIGMVACGPVRYEMYQHSVVAGNGRVFAVPGFGAGLFANDGTWLGTLDYCAWLIGCDHSAFAFSSDAKLIAAASYTPFYASLKVYSLQSGKLLWTHTYASFGAWGAIRAIAFSADGKRLHAATIYKQRTYELETGILLDTLADAPYLSITAAEGHLLFGQRGSVSVTGMHHHRFVCSEAPIARVLLSPSKSSLFVGDAHGTICIFDFQTGTLKWHTTLADPVPAIGSFDPNSDDLIVVGRNKLHLFPNLDYEKRTSIPCPGFILDVKAGAREVYVLRMQGFSSPSVLSAKMPLHSHSCSGGNGA